MAGLLPGIMISALFCISIVIRVRLNPSLANPNTNKVVVDEKANNAVEASVANKGNSKATIPAMVLIVIVLGTMYTGVATPTESAGFGAVGAIIIVLLLRRMSKNVFLESLKASARTSAMILFMIIFGMTLGFTISYLGIAQDLATFIVATGLNRWLVMIMLFVLWFVMGCLMDPGSMVILTIPFIYPSLMSMGFNPIWLGVVSTLCVEIGMITPPVGLNLFVLRSITDVEMKDIIRGALPYVGVLLVGLVILCVFPGIALWIPSMM
jgi:C4-dicarboxylate transporter DctM subunit